MLTVQNKTNWGRMSMGETAYFLRVIGRGLGISPNGQHERKPNRKLIKI
jgi:hypothetical protein